MFKKFLITGLMLVPSLCFAGGYNVASGKVIDDSGLAHRTDQIQLVSKSNGDIGTFVVSGTTAVSVTNSSVNSEDVIIPSLKTVGGTVGALPAVQSIQNGVGFTVKGTASDTSTYNYAIIRKAN